MGDSSENLFLRTWRAGTPRDNKGATWGVRRDPTVVDRPAFLKRPRPVESARGLWDIVAPAASPPPTEDPMDIQQSSTVIKHLHCLGSQSFEESRRDHVQPPVEEASHTSLDATTIRGVKHGVFEYPASQK